MTLRAEKTWLYFCGGMRRGGSTLQAQLVSAILGGALAAPASPATVRKLMDAPGRCREIHVCKCHEYVHELREAIGRGEAKVFYVYRDIRDVVASISRKYNIPVFSFIHGGVDPILREYYDWTSTPGAYVARYEEMLADLPGEVMRLAGYIGVRLDKADAARIAGEYGLEKQRARIRHAFQDGQPAGDGSSNSFDPASLLHWNHIQSNGAGFDSVMRPIEVAALEWVTRTWMIETGYTFRYSRTTRILAYAWFRTRAVAHRVRQSFSLAARRSRREDSP